MINDTPGKDARMQQIIKNIDHKVVELAPPMDDYDAGTINGLRLAREMVSNAAQQQWEDIYGGTECTEFRYIDDDLSV